MSRRVVLVDDHGLFLAGVRAELGDAVEVVGEAGTVARAIPLIKELDPENRAKQLWNRTQERISDRVGLTLGEAFSYETRGQIRDRLLKAGFAGFEAVEIGAGYPHAHILYVGRR